MKIKTNKETRVHKITVNDEELDAIYLAVTLLLESPLTHENWINRLHPIADKMDKALELENI